MSSSTAGLRSDSRSWMIQDDETVGALVRGLEAFCLHVVGGPMRRHRHIAVRHLGTYMQRIANHRIEEMRRSGGAQEVMAQSLASIFLWLGNEQKGILSPEPTAALDEVYGVSYHADRRAAVAGVGSDDGVHRLAVRGN